MLGVCVLSLACQVLGIMLGVCLESCLPGVRDHVEGVGLESCLSSVRIKLGVTIFTNVTNFVPGATRNLFWLTEMAGASQGLTDATL